MSTPSKKASRLLIGNGFALLLAFAFSQIGRTSFQELNLGWAIAIIACISLLLGFSMRSEKSSLLSEVFPDEDTVQTARRISEEMSEMNKEAKVSSAWAKLEVDLLEDELSGSEE